MMCGALDELTVFHGEASAALGRVYARLTASEATAGCELAGRVVGPRCRWAETLPAASMLVPRPGRTVGDPLANPLVDPLLAEAVVPDPCFWSDELPMLYTVEVELRRGGTAIAAAERSLGFRGVGRRGRSLFRQGRRWVPRGMSVASVSGDAVDDLADWREASAVMFVERPSDAICQRASEIGVWLIAAVDRGADAAVAELSRIARHSAVFLAVLPSGIQATAALRMAAPNLLLAERLDISSMSEPHEPSPHADCVFADAADVEAFAAAVGRCTLPVIAHRPLAAPQPIAVARRACDDLQRDLASVGDFTGYVV